MSPTAGNEPALRRVPAPAIAAAVLLAFAFGAPAFQAKPGAAQSGQQATGEKKASIEGVVLDGVSGKPVKDVTLLLARSGAGTFAPSSTKSDEQGQFAFKDLDVGRYLLIAEHPRYARQPYGSRAGLFGGTQLTLGAGQPMRELTFKLQANAVASGRVLDGDGEPVQGVLVNALKGLFLRGKRQLMPAGNATTNDLGEFRIANLAAGRYWLSASVMNPAVAPKTAAGEPQQAFTTTYYPNATDASGAAAVEVLAGGDVAGLDIRLAAVKAFRVTGKVTGVPNDEKLFVRLTPKDGGLLSMFAGRTARVEPKDGSFTFASVGAGSYILRVSDYTGMKQRGLGVPVEIGDRAPEPVALAFSGNADVAGKVTLEGDDKTPVTGLRVFLEVSAGYPLLPPNASAAADGTFMLKEVTPDRYIVRVINPPGNAYVSSVRSGDQEMPEQGLDLGHSGAGKVEIKLRAGGAQVDGVVNGQDDKPMPGATVALIPDSRQYLLYQSTMTDQNGAFSMKNIRPGEYKVLAWEEVEPNAFQDREFLKPFESKAESLSLKENDRKALTVKAVARERSAP